MPVKRKLLKTFAFFMILILFCPCFRASVRAQTSPDAQIEVELSYGFDNFTRFYRSTPVLVTITNNGHAISGIIRISFQDTNAQTTSYTCNFALISNDTDTFVVNTSYIPSYTNVQTEIFDNNGKCIYSMQALSLNQNTYDIYTGILSDSPEHMDYLKEIVFYSESYGNYYAMRPENLDGSPLLYHAESLKMMDILFLGEYDISKLSQKQLTAIREWIYDGGLLITGPAIRYPALWDALDLEPNYMDAGACSAETDFSVNHTAFNTLESPLSTQPLKENPTEKDITDARYNRTFLSIDNIIIEAAPVQLDFYETALSPTSDFKAGQWMQSVYYGSGSVLSLNFVFDSNTFAQWSGSAAAIYHIIDDFIGISDERFYAEYDSLPSYYSALSILPNSISVSDFSLGKYFAVLVVYILVVGPVLYVIFRKLDLRHWLWISIPCLSLLCLGFIYAIASDTRKNEPFLTQATTICYDTDKAREDVSVCAILPQKGQYFLEIPDIYRLRYYIVDGSTMYFPFSSFQEAVQNSQDYDINYTSANHATEITINNTRAFSEWYFNGTREYLTSQNIYITAVSDQGKYTIDIVNHTENDLDYSGLYIGGNVVITGPVSAGASIHLEEADVASIDTDAAESREYQSFLKILQMENTSEPFDPLLTQALAMISEDHYDTRDSRPVYFIGVSSHYESDALRDSQWPQYGSLLVTKSVDIQYESEDGHLLIPDINALECETDGLYDATYFYSDSCEVSYILPEDILLTNLSSDTQTAVDVYVYNFADNTYDPLERLKKDSEHTLSDYVDRQRIQIRMECRRASYDKWQLTPVISLEGVMQK